MVQPDLDNFFVIGSDLLLTEDRFFLILFFFQQTVLYDATSISTVEE